MVKLVRSTSGQINLADLDGANGFVINGANEVDFSGRSVSSAGDINGDGIDDLVIGAPFADPNGVDEAGESYVVFGSTSGFNTNLNLADLDGSSGFVINGIDPFDNSGGSVSSAGDINGDGVDDLIIGARFAGPNGVGAAGESYVVFGSTAGFSASLNLADLDGGNGFVINGIDEFDLSGDAVSSAGDVNGDGIGDVIIGAILADPNGEVDAGESYVVFGSLAGFEASLDLADLNGSNGFVINGVESIDFFGISHRTVSLAGDVNGDGIGDLIIGALGASPDGLIIAGESYVVFGSVSGFGASLNLADLDGSNGFSINGIDAFDLSGGSVSSAGDINGDGIDDLIIGARGGDPNGTNAAGESYVVFGSTSGFDASLNLADLNGSNGFVINGIDVLDRSGRSVSSAGDVNGDGIDDLIIGAGGADPNGEVDAGESYVVFGSLAGFGANLNLADLNGSNGFVINGADGDDLSGRSVSSAGDINGDGISDLIIGAPFADTNEASVAGESYVVFGGNNTFDALQLSFTVQATTEAELFIAASGVDTFIFDEESSTLSAIDEIQGIGLEDTLDISALGLSPEDVEFRVVGDVLKIIEGFGADDFQLRLQFNGLTSEEIQSLIVFEAAPVSPPPSAENIIDAATGREVLVGTDEIDRFVFEVGDSLTGQIDVILGWAPGDIIDLTALGLDPDNIEVRDFGSAIKLVEGFGSDDFQLRIELGGQDAQAVLDSIIWSDANSNDINIVDTPNESDFLFGTVGVDHFAFDGLTSTTGDIAVIVDWQPGDMIDVSTAGITEGAFEVRSIADGVLIKLIEGFGADDTQIKIETNGHDVQLILNSIIYADDTAVAAESFSEDFLVL